MLISNQIVKKLFIGTLAGLFILYGTQESIAREFSLRTVNIKKFVQIWEEKNIRNQAILLDVRTQNEFRQGHAPGALLIDFYKKDFRQRLDRLDRNKTYFIYCNSGRRSGLTLRMMKSLGFREVYNLAGGWSRHHAALRTLRARRNQG